MKKPTINYNANGSKEKYYYNADGSIKQKQFYNADGSIKKIKK